MIYSLSMMFLCAGAGNSSVRMYRLTMLPRLKRNLEKLIMSKGGKGVGGGRAVLLPPCTDPESQAFRMGDDIAAEHPNLSDRAKVRVVAYFISGMFNISPLSSAWNPTGQVLDAISNGLEWAQLVFFSTPQMLGFGESQKKRRHQG